MIDPNGKVMTTYTRNIGLRFFMGTTEKVRILTIIHKEEKVLLRHYHNKHVTY